jgi:hypothetical protein
MYSVYFLETSSDTHWRRIVGDQPLEKAESLASRCVSKLGYFCGRASLNETEDLVPREEIKGVWRRRSS